MKFGRRPSPEAASRRGATGLPTWAVAPLVVAIAVTTLPNGAARAETSELDFESGWSEGLVDLRAADVRNTRQTTEGLSDAGLDVTIPAGSLRGLGAIDRLEPGVQEAWYRYHIQLEDFHVRSSGKLPGLSGLYSHTGRGCKPSRPGAPGWSARGLFGPEGFYGAPDGEVPIGTYIYHLNQPGRCGEAVFWDDASLQPGRWHCIEGHVRLNTPGVANGQITGWLDGVEKYHRGNFVFRRPREGNVGVREMWLNIYYGGRKPTSNTLNLMIDEVRVSSDGRVGCHESSTSLVTSSDQADAIAVFSPSTGSWQINRWKEGTPALETLPSYTTGDRWSTHLVGDFGGDDGIDDIASFHPSNGSWWVSRSGRDGFQTTRWGTYGPPTGWGAHLSGDFMGNGQTQIASFQLANGSWWLSTPTISDAVGGPEVEPKLAHRESDANPRWTSGDPGADIVRDLTWRLEPPADRFETSLWERFTTTTGWTKQIVGDYNRDGRDDIANYHPASGTWWVSISSGEGFSTSQWDRFGTTRGWSNQVGGDFDGDGIDDIASYHPASGTWWVSRSTGSRFTTATWEQLSTRTGWGTQLSGDFNGDGRDDIANYHSDSGSWWVSVSSGNGFTTTQWADFSTAYGWSTHLAGDFDDDGDLDIASHHLPTDSWWLSISNRDGFATTLWGG
jgi:hypothetical protein